MLLTGNILIVWRFKKNYLKRGENLFWQIFVDKPALTLLLTGPNWKWHSLKPGKVDFFMITIMKILFHKNPEALWVFDNYQTLVYKCSSVKVVMVCVLEENRISLQWCWCVVWRVAFVFSCADILVFTALPIS